MRETDSLWCCYSLETAVDYNALHHFVVVSHSRHLRVLGNRESFENRA